MLEQGFESSVIEWILLGQHWLQLLPVTSEAFLLSQLAEGWMHEGHLSPLGA